MSDDNLTICKKCEHYSREVDFYGYRFTDKCFATTVSRVPPLRNFITGGWIHHGVGIYSGEDRCHTNDGHCPLYAPKPSLWMRLREWLKGER